MTALRARALELLRAAVGREDADFRDGQWEAIEALVRDRARLLLVRRTGWGKSAVYFLSAKLLREQGAGPSLLISPLLALMRNQIEAAQRAGVRAATVNWTNRSEWDGVIRRLATGEIDVLLISPERLSDDGFVQRYLRPHPWSMLIVDEAHCISDWGHDFRPDYRRIRAVQRLMPAGFACCATTATANDRVVKDVEEQLGAGLRTSRGPLARSSLRLHVVRLEEDATKLAWLAEWIPRFKSSGIVYVLTVEAAIRVSDWLRSRKINARPYWSGLGAEAVQRERQLQSNELTALVATTALGMGYDKPDLGFVVHYHQPASVVHYYQQVGRAGRAIERGYGILLAGGGSDPINDHFQQTAFPEESEVERIYRALDESEYGLTLNELEQNVNLPRERIEQIVKLLAVTEPSPLVSVDRRWRTTLHKDDPLGRARVAERVRAQRREERTQMDAYVEHAGCRMQFLACALDDSNAGPCEVCTNCQGRSHEMCSIDPVLRGEAAEFLRRQGAWIPKQSTWPSGAMPSYGWHGKINPSVQVNKGRALCVLRDPTWGRA